MEASHFEKTRALYDRVIDLLIETQMVVEGILDKYEEDDQELKIES